MLFPATLFEIYNVAIRNFGQGSEALPMLSKRADDKHSAFHTVSIILIPILVIISGIFAGLTLGYMSLDETQLNVLAASGTPKQQEYAKKIIPVRKNGHLLLITLLLGNMIVNETLPVITDEALGSGITAVAVSTILIVIFAEIIPQSVCTRYGLYIGAKMAIPTRIIMYALWVVAWPVSKLLELILGPHHGIIYRRAELKELINMHSSISSHGGDLKHDTVTIIGHTLDLQEKVVKDAMTPISKVFMLPISAHLDYDTLRKVCESGHSRVPVYEEVEVQQVGSPPGASSGTTTAKKILGVLLVKHCVLLDPKDNVPLRSLPLNKIPSVPYDESLLGILDRFQEGRSHMAIVSLFSKGLAADVKETVKTSLTHRFLNRVGLRDDEEDEEETTKNGDIESGKGGMAGGEGAQVLPVNGTSAGTVVTEHKGRKFMVGIEGREQAMPADAVLASKDAENFLRSIDTHINPLGLITLEDVLEELIGEEILDEFDLTGPQAASSYVPPSASRHHAGKKAQAAQQQQAQTQQPTKKTLLTPKAAGGLNIFTRSRSQPPTSHTETSDVPSVPPQLYGDSPGHPPTSPPDTTAIKPDTEGNKENKENRKNNKDSSSASQTTGAANVPPGPLLAEAIIRTQNRRRAQVRSNSLNSDVGGGAAVVPKAGFKSSTSKVAE